MDNRLAGYFRQQNIIASQLTMASIFKRRPKRKNEIYLIQYVDHRGKRRTVKGFTDKGLTEELAARLESEARLRTAGLIDPTQDRIAEYNHAGIEVHLKAFEQSLKANTPKYIKLTMGRVRRIVDGCGFVTLAAIDADDVQDFLTELQEEEDLGHRTYNHYLQAMDAFCNWCVPKRMLCNPLAGLERLNTAVDVRHQRRALAPEEFSSLVQSARDSGKRIQGLSGEQRARVYILSYMTGLRRKEIGSLTPQSFKLELSPPTVTVQAACSKHRRKDVLPLHPDLVVMLRTWLKGLKPAEKLFSGLENKKTWLMVRKDLERVGIPYETEEGIADFHAAGRHTHITELLRNGATLPEAKELARHSDVNMTMRYTHIGIKDQAKAVANLPAPKGRPAEPATPTEHRNGSALQMRCRFCSAESRSVTFPGNGDVVLKRENPCRSKGSGVDRRQVSSPDKVEAAGIEPASRIFST
jgi:site-specific recombinase XerD